MKLLNDLYALLEQYALYEAAGFAWITMLLLILYIWQNQRIHTMKQRSHMANLLLEHVQASKGVEKNIHYLLEQAGTVIDAPVYAFYTFDVRNKQYYLKGVRHSQADFGKVRPSYSGLANYKKEAYMPPITLSNTSIPSTPEMVYEGEVPLFIVPLGDKGMIRIGPIKKVNKKTRMAMSELSVQIQHVLPELILSEQLRNQVDVVVASGKALQNISDVALDTRETIKLILAATMRSLGAYGAVYADRLSAAPVFTAAGLSASRENAFRSDAPLQQRLLAMAKDQAALLQEGEAGWGTLPEHSIAEGTQGLLCMAIGERALLAFWFRSKPDMDRAKAGELQLIASDLAQLIHSQEPLQQLSKVYIHTLKRLARTMDNLNPYTVGYSDQMSRYAIIIGKELGLPDDEIRDIALAAYLSNIGVLGLSSDLYQKEGKYTEAEYEMMKLHAEVGASVVSITTGNKRVASYIMHHHERMDGAGYPAGLRGMEIPLGARIIAVVQTFLAKINGRKQRDPLPFDKALQMLVSASGTQLDKVVVDALLSWYSKKRSDRSIMDHSLGNCWDMCCTPSSICEHCPVYRQSGTERRNCWEIEENHCSAHGKSCSTCFVHTEFLTRAMEKQKAGSF